jgi:ferredoxin-type protein NapF
VVYAVTRFELFRGHGKRRDWPIRPPWALHGEAFSIACTGGGDCINACPENILRANSEGLPTVSFGAGQCTFCGACVEACPTGALAIAPGAEPWNLKAEITNTCLSILGTTCHVCGERCDVQAIAFRLAVGGAALPEIDASMCTGCGACIAPCPVRAIRIQ